VAALARTDSTQPTTAEAARPSTPEKATRRRPRSRVTPRWAPYFFIAPFFVLFGVFFGLPTLRSLQLSFYTERGVDTSAEFSGLDNYATLVGDPTFYKALANTSYYALGSILVIVPLALSLALLLRTRGLLLREFFRLSFFLPNAISGIVVAIVFRLVFDQEYGLLNNWLLAPLGLPKVGWLADPTFIMPSIVLLGIWQYTGLNALYFMVGLQNQDPGIHEAATVDGAGPWQRFRYITLPLLRPTMVFVVTFAIIGSYQLFAQPVALVGEGGGPNRAGLTLTMYLYETAFTNLDLGYGAAIGYAITVIIVVLSVLQMWAQGFFRREPA
jgi:ABC-type sugar transport system permease subunit